MIRTTIAIGLLGVAFTAGSAAKLLQHIPLEWKPTSDLRLGTMQMTASTVTIAPFTDGRENKEAIGENREDAVPKPVTTTDDVGTFVSTHMRALFDRAGIKTVDSDGDVTIEGEVRQFFVREESTYKSTVVIHLTVLDKGGKTLWTGLGSGDATRFGRSYKAENYYEVLSDAVVNTVSSMMQDAGFQKALSGEATAPST